MRLKSTIPVVILGVPIPDSDNPFLVVPVASAIVEVEFSKCSNPSLAYEGIGGIGGLLESFWFNLSRGLALSLCPKLTLAKVDGVNKPPMGGLYATLTSSLLYSLHRLHGDVPQVLDIVETSSLVDLVHVDRAWRLALEALRYSSISGKPVAYRGPLEVYEFEGFGSVRVDVGDHVGNVRSLISREELGSSVYGALIHLMGEVVLEASMRVRDGARIEDVVRIFKYIHDGVTLSTYGLKPRSESCLWSPGLPWAFDEVCLVNRG